jgi:hypothetical protein
MTMRAMASAACVNFEARADITRCEDARVGRLQPVVDPDPFLPLIAHAGRLQVEAFHVGHTAGADEERIHDGLPLSFAAGDVNDLFVPPLLDSADLAAQGQLHAVPPQGLCDLFGGVLVLSGQDLRMIAQ